MNFICGFEEIKTYCFESELSTYFMCREIRGTMEGEASFDSAEGLFNTEAIFGDKSVETLHIFIKRFVAKSFIHNTAFQTFLFKHVFVFSAEETLISMDTAIFRETICNNIKVFCFSFIGRGCMGFINETFFITTKDRCIIVFKRW